MLEINVRFQEETNIVAVSRHIVEKKAFDYYYRLKKSGLLVQVQGYESLAEAIAYGEKIYRQVSNPNT